MVANEQGGTRPGYLPAQLLLLSWGPQDTVLFAVFLVVFHSACEYLHRATMAKEKQKQTNKSQLSYGLSINTYKSSAAYLQLHDKGVTLEAYGGG